MKTTLFIALVILGFNLSAQTSIISTKSHAGLSNSYLEASDNYGVVAPRPVYDTVIQIDNSCLVMIGTRWQTNRFRDTVCDHWAFENGEMNQTTINEYFGEEVTFLDSRKKAKPEGGQGFWFNGRQHQNGINLWFMIILLSISAYILVPVIKKRNS
jgi:hypothetical protein